MNKKSRIFAFSSVLLVLVGAIGASIFWFVCPCERTPGGPIALEQNDENIDDWSFANEVKLCQIEVKGVIPWSVNLNCMSTDQRLFISCARCDGKYWSGVAMDNPLARIGIGDRAYPVKLRRVLDPEELDLAWEARARKTGRGLGSERASHWWSFELTSL